jgi:hypothetical protein
MRASPYCDSDILPVKEMTEIPVKRIPCIIMRPVSLWGDYRSRREWQAGEEPERFFDWLVAQEGGIISLGKLSLLNRNEKTRNYGFSLSFFPVRESI